MPTNRLIEDIIPQLLKAVENGDLASAQKYIALWSQAERVTGLSVGGRLGTEVGTGLGILIKISDGALAQSFLPLRKAACRGLLLKADEVEIHIPLTGASFKSDLVMPNCFLRERKRISEFYRAAEVRGGDYIHLLKVGHKSFELRKVARQSSWIFRKLQGTL